ncbi:MAG: hypothetical protein QM775_32100 [Pirellulales bacterium]
MLQTAKDNGLMPFLRVSIVPDNSTAGFSYSFKFVDGYNAQTDIAYHRDGLVIILDRSQVPHLRGAVLDYVEDSSGKGFSFTRSSAF